MPYSDINIDLIN